MSTVFRLLSGYEDDIVMDIGDRRALYIISNYINNRDLMKEHEVTSYLACEDEEEKLKIVKKEPSDRLRKVEDELIAKLANAISFIKDLPAYIEDVDEYLVQVPAHSANAPKITILTPDAPRWEDDRILGRDDFVVELCQALQESNSHLQLTGMGGIGKTEILNKIYTFFADNPDAHSITHVGLVRYTGSLGRGLSQQLALPKSKPGIDVIKYLGNLGDRHKVLLLIDDIRPQQEKKDQSIAPDESFSQLFSVKASILLSSRVRKEGFTSRRVKLLTTPECLDVFQAQRYNTDDDESDDSEIIEVPELPDEDRTILRDIIENRAGRNPLIVNRLGVMVRDHRWSISQLNEELKNRNFGISKGIRNTDGEDAEELQEEIDKLYRLEDIQKAGDRSILEAFTMFSSIPLETTNCVKWFADDAGLDEGRCSRALSRLAMYTWLMSHKKKGGNQFFFSMHQMVQAAVKSQANIQRENHQNLIERSWGFVDMEAKKADGTAWSKHVEAKPGDTINYRIQYKNTGDIAMKNVLIRNILPPGLVYLEGSTEVYNSNNPEGVAVSDSIISSTGMNIGEYGLGANAWIYFSATVEDTGSISNKIQRNTVEMNGGFVTKTSFADVVILG